MWSWKQLIHGGIIPELVSLPNLNSSLSIKTDSIIQSIPSLPHIVPALQGTASIEKCMVPAQ